MSQKLLRCTVYSFHCSSWFWLRPMCIIVIVCQKYTVSQKTSPTFLAVTWKLIIRFWSFLVRIFLTKPHIKRPFSFPPHPMYASALPRESRSSEICIEINRKPEKNIPGIINHNLKNWQILIIFGRNISDTTGY